MPWNNPLFLPSFPIHLSVFKPFHSTLCLAVLIPSSVGYSILVYAVYAFLFLLPTNKWRRLIPDSVSCNSWTFHGEALSYSKFALYFIYGMCHHKFETQFPTPNRGHSTLIRQNISSSWKKHLVELVARFCVDQTVPGPYSGTGMFRHCRLPRLFHCPLSSQHLPHPASIPVSNYFHLCMEQASKGKWMKTGCALQTVHKVRRPPRHWDPRFQSHSGHRCMPSISGAMLCTG